LPLDHVLAASSIRRQVTTLGRRLEAVQVTDARQQAEVTASVRSPHIPEPSPIRAVGIDGGYLRRAGHRLAAAPSCTTCCKSGRPCSITSSGLTWNDGIRTSPEKKTIALPLS